MRDEDVLHGRDRDARGHQLAADARPAIDHNGHVVDHDEIGGVGGGEPDARPTLGPEQHDARAWLLHLRPLCWSLAAAEHAVERRQAEDRRERDQDIADAAKQRFTGAAEQQGAAADADRIDRAHHQ
jgi:hypothetical protein